MAAKSNVTASMTEGHNKHSNEVNGELPRHRSLWQSCHVSKLRTPSRPLPGIAIQNPAQFDVTAIMSGNQHSRSEELIGVVPETSMSALVTGMLKVRDDRFGLPLHPFKWLLFFSFTFFPLVSSGGGENLLASFISSPPPIREMVVELQWFHKPGETNVIWLALAWQTNGYVFRKSKQRTGLCDKFDIGCDEIITIRTNNSYIALLNSESLGFHAEIAEGIHSDERDLVSPKINGQETLASYALSVGLGPPLGAFQLTNHAFRFRDEALRRTVSGQLYFGPSNEVRGIARTNSVDAISITNDADKIIHRKAVQVPLWLQFGYGKSDVPDWFPNEAVSEATIGGKTSSNYRVKFHHLEFGTVSMTEFSPERFLERPIPIAISTTNGISYVAINGLLTPVLSSSDPGVKGAIQAGFNGSGYKRAVVLVIACATTATTVALFMLYRKKQRP